MSTTRRIRASRENGARSHGPITPEGKRRSSRNGFHVRHGILSQTVVLEGEDPAAFSDLLSSLEAELQPRTPHESALVENMAISRWRLMRLWGIEKESLTQEMAKTDSAASPATRAARAFRTLSDESRSLENLHRYETRYDRQYARSYYLLRKSRLPAPPPPNLPYEPSPISEHIRPNPAIPCVICPPTCANRRLQAGDASVPQPPR